MLFSIEAKYGGCAWSSQRSSGGILFNLYIFIYIILYAYILKKHSVPSFWKRECRAPGAPSNMPQIRTNLVCGGVLARSAEGRCIPLMNAAFWAMGEEGSQCWDLCWNTLCAQGGIFNQ